MNRAALPLALMGAASCSGGPGDSGVSHEQDRLGGSYVTLQSEDVVDGARPELTISCGSGEPSFFLKLIRVPAPPPPLRGVFGTFKVDDAAAARLELAWLTGDRWALRSDEKAEAALVRAMLGGRNVYFSGPEGTTDRAYRWDMGRVGAGLEEFRRACG